MKIGAQRGVLMAAMLGRRSSNLLVARTNPFLALTIYARLTMVCKRAALLERPARDENQEQDE
jgi:hypothetical protein